MKIVEFQARPYNIKSIAHKLIKNDIFCFFIEDIRIVSLQTKNIPHNNIPFLPTLRVFIPVKEKNIASTMNIISDILASLNSSKLKSSNNFNSDNYIIASTILRDIDIEIRT